MELGNFSVSLAVKNIEASRLFYEKLGFTIFMGDQKRGWLITKNGAHVIGLFQGMFDKNVLTFNRVGTAMRSVLEKLLTFGSSSAN
jgi:lactoylglutathione lyase